MSEQAPNSPADSPGQNRRRWLRWLGLVLAGGVLWISLLDFPTLVAADDLDPSWARALGYCLTQRWQAGSDYLFTYGPLGYFTTPVYDPDLYWWRYLWEVGIKLLLAGLFLRLLLGLPRWWLRAGFYVLILFLFPRRNDLPHIFLIVSLVAVVLLTENPGRCLLAGCAGVLAILALTKFTFCLLGGFALGCLLVALGRQGRWQAVLGTAALYGLSVVALWVVLGQSWSNVLPYLRGAIDLARGYSEAMTVPGDNGRLWLSLGILLVLALAGLTLGKPPRQPATLSGLALLAGLLVLEWKHGFVRQASHQAQYFTTTLFLPLLLLPLGVSRSSVKLAFLVVVLSLLGHCPVSWEELLDAKRVHSLGVEALSHPYRQVAGLLAPLRMQRQLEEEQARLARRWDLPRIRSHVGEEPVDLLTHQQGIVFLNRFRWQPRPVFQSYSAYTPALLEANAAFYRSSRVPRYVLVRLSSIDERFPCLEDSPTLLILLQRYTLVTEEKGFLLLQRDQPAPFHLTEPLPSKTIRLGEWVSLPPRRGAGGYWARLHLSYSLYGKLRRLVYRTPIVYLTVRTESGTERTYRLVPAMARVGFLLDPLIEDTEDFQDLYRSLSSEAATWGKEGKRVLALRVSTQGSECFEPLVSLELKGCGQDTGK
jgi:hypothetical protein